MKEGDKVYILTDTRQQGKGIGSFILFATLVEEVEFAHWKVEYESVKTHELKEKIVYYKDIYPTFEIALYAMDARSRKGVWHAV